MRPSQVLRRAADYLERHEIQAPRPTAEQLLARILGVDRAGLYLRDTPLDPDESKAFGRALSRRCAGTPTQHVTGETGFRHLILTVRPGVFVPRTETEVVVGAVLDVMRDRPTPAVVDVGTGTGAIALAVKQERSDSRVWAVDRSSEAAALARHNARRTGLDIGVVQADLLDGLDASTTGALDVVVSNPPYLEADDLASLPREVRADPTDALVGGVAVYAALFDQASPRLVPCGALVVEIDERRAKAVTAAALGAGATGISVVTDLAGRERAVVATWP
ncbi:peptide chain release factor N(5)-glutamine methyltransferase [soil metagenome]